jgi:hypothetical protein
MSAQDAALGAVVLAGNQYWKNASYWKRLTVLVHGRKDVFTHFEKRLVVKWINDVPYLISIREVTAS